MVHDFVRFPELSNSQMATEYWNSPHKQITEDFTAEVIKVTDGDTITVRWEERDFDFPVRFLNTNAPEMSEEGGKESKEWLEGILLNQEVDIRINPAQRVGKWGRILGNVIHGGISLNEQSIIQGWATPFDDRNEGQIPNIQDITKEGEF